MPKTLGGARRWLFVRLVANGVAQAAAMVGAALIIRDIFDTHIVSSAEPDENALVVSIIGLTLVGLITALLRLAERVDAERFGQSYAFSVRRRLFEQLIRINPRNLVTRQHGNILLRFIGDLGALRRWLSMGLARLASAGLLIVLTFAALALVNAPLAMIVMLSLTCGAVLTVSLGPPLEAAIRDMRRRRSRMADFIAEKTAAMLVAQSHGQQTRERRRLRRHSERVRSTSLRRAALVGALRGVSEASIRVSTSLALLVGGYEVANGNATAGTVVAAMTIVGFIAAPVRDLSRVYDYWQAGRVSHEKLRNFLALRDVMRGPRHPLPLPEGNGRLEFRDVCVTDVFSEVNMTTPPGKVIALLGANGAGKSTLLWLAARLIDPDKGQVFLDGQDLRKLGLDELRRNIGIVSADIPLLRGTVEQNILYRCVSAPAEELQRVYALCGINDVNVDSPILPGARVSAGGRNLSQGQRQRIALARALIGSPRVLLLDEPETGLDKDARLALDHVVKKFNGTLLLATHDPARVSLADEVWRIRNGSVTVGKSPDVDDVAASGQPARSYATAAGMGV